MSSPSPAAMPQQRAEPSDKPRRRRGRRGGSGPLTELCQREGCRQRRPGPNSAHYGSSYCTRQCRSTALQVEQAERLCRLLGGGPKATELWVSAVALNDALTEYDRCYEAARSAHRKQNKQQEHEQEQEQ